MLLSIYPCFYRYICKLRKLCRRGGAQHVLQFKLCHCRVAVRPLVSTTIPGTYQVLKCYTYTLDLGTSFAGIRTVTRSGLIRWARTVTGSGMSFGGTRTTTTTTATTTATTTTTLLLLLLLLPLLLPSLLRRRDWRWQLIRWVPQRNGF